MWPFVKDLKLLPLLAADAGFFEKTKLPDVTRTFERIAHRAGTALYHGNVLTSDWLNLFRVLSNKKFVARHVMMAVGNFRNFKALVSYDMDENDWERFLLRDATIFFIVVIQEALLCYRNSFDLSLLIGEVLETPESSRLVAIFSKFFDSSSQPFLEEFSYCMLFYLAMSQTSRYQWKQWNSYKELPDGAFEILSDESTEAESLKLKAAVMKRLTLTNNINKFFLLKKIESLTSDDQREERRRYEFILCVLEPDEHDHYRSLLRSLALCSNDSHCERLKSWLEQKARFDPDLEDVDWDDDGQWESYDEDDEPVVKPRHIICWNMIAHRITQRRFVEAISLLDKVDGSKDDDEENARRNMIWGYAAIQTNDRTLMKRGQSILADVAKTHPIANYWLAEMNVRLSNFTEAFRFLKDAHFEPVAIPCTQEYLKPLSEKDYEVRIEQLKRMLEAPPKPEHICCRQDCDSKKIYENSLGFNGLAQVECGSDCVLTFHADCWKLVVQNSLVAENKHGLGSRCYTPDCPGKIVLLKLFDSKMHLKKEYRWTIVPERTPTCFSILDDDMFESLRIAIHQLKDRMSKQEITSFCEEFSNADGDLISSFVDSCVEDDQGPNPEWTKAQWLQRLHAQFEMPREDLNLAEINRHLNSMIITERIAPDEVDSVELEYAQLEAELSGLLNEEAGLRNQLHGQHRLPVENDLERILEEIKEIERREVDATEAENALKTLKRNLDLKKEVLVNFADRLKDAQTKLSEVEANLSQDGLRHQNLQDDRASLLHVVKQNASETRASLRRALMELNETRYAIAQDNLQAVERAVARNLREAEKQDNPELRKLNRDARERHFRLLNEVVTEIRRSEETAKAITLEIQNGDRDSTDVDVQEDQMITHLQRYADLPNISVSMRKPTLRGVADSLN